MSDQPGSGRRSSLTLRRCAPKTLYEFMKNIIPTISTILIMTSTSYAGVMGWFTSEARDWEFVKKTGGIRVLAPIKMEGRLVLPVEVDPSGLTAITTKPTLMNSGLTVRKIEIRRNGSRLMIRVFTQVAEKGTASGGIHYADLEGVPQGKYTVSYGTEDDPVRTLGEIEVK